ncbi:hypothetical protein G6F29_011304 [Rhizopus arrhizus]|uniref:Uncharacterized protein n=1 Tax=Rhizopus oryzae TaxID=64495 RepID=A0A9P6XD23_RHIOR|nr:hypothetical protein G6F23_010445 [Rhizopus arrhizus]KAG0806478.1 hypothetical protein G6F20_011090 [Rhizopus arrhizus]KAG0822899.1 hypothetical protein G6F19_011118 [Rhizopus arrhizus]KAG0823810.1 hypothetical protein G6F18_011132 [Rhizopus arrhizus]KAG0849126.1 hypothetical protein G6F17_011041 [Rhizopus arrhizus]
MLYGVQIRALSRSVRKVPNLVGFLPPSSITTCMTGSTILLDDKISLLTHHDICKPYHSCCLPRKSAIHQTRQCFSSGLRSNRCVPSPSVANFCSQSRFVSFSVRFGVKSIVCRSKIFYTNNKSNFPLLLVPRAVRGSSGESN